MTIEWIRFWIVALLTLLGILTLAVAIFGTFRFKFALNRITLQPWRIPWLCCCLSPR